MFSFGYIYFLNCKDWENTFAFQKFSNQANAFTLRKYKLFF